MKLWLLTDRGAMDTDIQETERRRQVAAMQPTFLLFLLLLGIWLFAHPWAGIWHDAQLYALQALSRLHPDAYRNDLFFFSGSQDDYTFFSPIYAALISLLGLHAAAIALLLAAYVLWTGSAAWLVRSLLQSFPFWVGLAMQLDTLRPEAAATPAAAVQAARKAHLTGPVLNEYGLGDYLIFSGIPPFIDGRADMYGDDFLREYMEAVSLKNSDGLPRLLQKYRIEWTLLLPESAAVALLDHLPEWRRLYADKVAVVHVRKSVLDKETNAVTGSAMTRWRRGTYRYGIP